MWSEVEKKFAREIEELKKHVKHYEYSEKRAVETDESVRGFFLDKLNKSKTVLNDVLELAYKENASEISELKNLKDDLDLAKNDVEKLNLGKFPKDKNTLEQILLKEVSLLNDSNRVSELVSSLYNNVTNSDVQNLAKAVQEIRTVLGHFRENFEERSNLIKSEYGK